MHLLMLSHLNNASCHKGKTSGKGVFIYICTLFEKISITLAKKLINRIPRHY